ncbi:MAG: NUDIX domain-containing protein [Planctomycetota bacterium]
MSEQVYVVPRAVLFPEGAPHGFFADGLALLPRIYEEGYFAPRAAVEEDPSLQQIIPYAIVVRGDEVFRFRRRAGGEARLNGLSSIGVGGHVNPPDAKDVVHDALRRELEEELHIPAERTVELLGLLNDDSTAVGAVHVGVVARVDVGSGDVRVREEETMEGSFVDRATLLGEPRDSFETWSAFLLDELDTRIGVGSE